MSATRRVVVVGGGISGLAAAQAIGAANSGAEVLVLEQSAQVGGKLRVSEVAGVPVDEGAEALLARRPEGIDLARSAGLGDDLEPPATLSSQLFARGRLRSLPTGHVMGVPVNLRSLADTGLLSRAELVRATLDLALPRSTPEDEAALDDISVGSYVTGRLGRPVTDRVVGPLLGGVYAGDPNGLSLAATLPQLVPSIAAERSLLHAARRVRNARPESSSGPVFVSPRGGLGRLPAAVVAAMPAQVRTGVTVRELRRTPAGWQVICGAASGPAEVVEADAVVVAVPAAPAARLLRPHTPVAAAALAEIEYAGVVVATLAYSVTDANRPAIERLGSGFLVGAGEGRAVKGVTVSSKKWGWYAQAAPALAFVRASLGRHGDAPDGVLQRTDEELLAAVRRDLRDLAGLDAEPIDTRVTRWGGALPQYAPGHLRRVRTIQAALSEDPALATLAVCGAAYDGVGVPACIASGQAAASRVFEGLAPAAAAVAGVSGRAEE